MQLKEAQSLCSLEVLLGKRAEMSLILILWISQAEVMRRCFWSVVAKESLRGGSRVFKSVCSTSTSLVLLGLMGTARSQESWAPGITPHQQKATRHCPWGSFFRKCSLRLDVAVRLCMITWCDSGCLAGPCGCTLHSGCLWQGQVKVLCPLGTMTGWASQSSSGWWWVQLVPVLECGTSSSCTLWRMNNLQELHSKSEEKWRTWSFLLLGASCAPMAHTVKPRSCHIPCWFMLGDGLSLPQSKPMVLNDNLGCVIQNWTFFWSAYISNCLCLTPLLSVIAAAGWKNHSVCGMLFNENNSLCLNL